MNELVKFVGDAPQLPADRTATWLLMGRGKLVLDQGLQTKALELQQILAGYESITVENVPTLTEKLALYRSKHTEIVNFRRSYTTFLDQATEQCMKTEKAYDPKTNEIYKKAAALELQLREQAQAKLNAASDKATEIASFNAHVKNEYFRIAADYRQKLAHVIHQAYTACLSVKTPPDQVTKTVDIAKAAMKDTKPLQMDKFKRTLVSDTEALELFNKIPKPDWPAIYKEAIAALEEKFSMYANDLASADVVIQQQQIEFDANTARAGQELEQQQAATTLTEAANAFVAPVAGFKSVVEVSKIVIKDDDQRFVVTIMAAFMANFQKCFPLVRVKKYSQLNIAQMAAALDQAGVKVEGVEYTDIKK